MMGNKHDGSQPIFPIIFSVFFPHPTMSLPSRATIKQRFQTVNSFQLKGGVEKPHNKSFHSISSIFKSKNPSLKN